MMRGIRNLRAIMRSVALASTFLAAAALDLHAESYSVRPGDRLNISILGKDEFSGPVNVRDDGTIRVHMLGSITVSGQTLTEIEDSIVKSAKASFDEDISVVINIDEFRPVFVMGAVETPGSYAYAPGMTVIKAIALAGGYERAVSESGDDRFVRDAQRRVEDAQTRLKFSRGEWRAIVAELERAKAGSAELDASVLDGVDSDQIELYQAGRAILDESVEGFRRTAVIAESESELHAKRGEIISRQLLVTQQQLDDIQKLVDQGLSRRETLVSLKVDVDDFLSDEFETAAAEARAKQTAAGAENDIAVAKARYLRDLLAEKLEVEQRIALFESDLNTSMGHLRLSAPAVAVSMTAQVETVFEVYRSGSSGEAVQVELTSPMNPDDVLVVRFEGVSN